MKKPTEDQINLFIYVVEAYGDTAPMYPGVNDPDLIAGLAVEMVRRYKEERNKVYSLLIPAASKRDESRYHAEEIPGTVMSRIIRTVILSPVGEFLPGDEKSEALAVMYTDRASQFVDFLNELAVDAVERRIDSIDEFEGTDWMRDQLRARAERREQGKQATNCRPQNQYRADPGAGNLV